MSLIECKNISFSYEGKTIVSELSFNVEAGDYLCIVGENGSGKSTLIKGLLGLKAPSSGKIIFGGGLTQKEIGYLPSKPEYSGIFLPRCVKLCFPERWEKVRSALFTL